MLFVRSGMWVNDVRSKNMYTPSKANAYYYRKQTTVRQNSYCYVANRYNIIAPDGAVYLRQNLVI